MALEDPDSSAGVGPLTREDAVGLLNEAKLSDKDDKQNLLAQVFEFAFNSQRQYLPEFFPHLLEFELDPSVAIRKYVIGCIETICKTIPECIYELFDSLQKDITQCVDHLCRLVGDENGNVVKRAILCATNTWRGSLEFLCAGGLQVTPQQITTWASLTELKSNIVRTLDTDNDPLKPHTLKFVEILISTFTFPDPPSNDKKSKVDTFNLSSIPPNHPLLNRDALRREGETHLQQLLDLLKKPNQTAQTIISVVNTLANIARQRQHLIITITPALISLQQQPSPSFASYVQSQLNNVNHSLRLAMQAILRLRNPTLVPLVVALVDSLTHLGVKDSVDEATKLYGDLALLPQPPPENRKRPPESPPRGSREERSSKVMKTEKEPSNTAQAPKSSHSPPPAPTSPPPPIPLPTNTLNQTEHSSILGLLAQLPGDLLAKLVFENMAVFPLPAPGSLPGPTNIGDFLRSLQPQTAAPTPAPRVDPRTDPRADPRAEPRVDPRVQPRDPRVRPGPEQKVSAPASAPRSPPNPNPNIIVQTPQAQAPSIQPQMFPAQPAVPNQPELPRPVDPRQPPPLDPRQPPLDHRQPPLDPRQAPPVDPRQPSQSTPPAPIQSNQPTHPVQVQPAQPVQPVQPVQTVKPQLPKAPVLPLPTFTDAQLRTLSDATFGRIMGYEEGATRGGKRSLWIALVARLAATLPLDGEMAQKLVSYIMADFPNRRELVHTWIYHEFVASPDTRYPQLIDSLLAALRTLDPSNRAFNALIVELPRLSEEVWDMMCEYSTSRERVTLGLSTLRDLVVWRPPVRERGLALILEYTHHEEEAIRSPAIRLVANQLYNLQALSQAIVEYAIAMLNSLVSTQDTEMQDTDLGEAKVKVEPVEADVKTENGDKKEEDNKDSDIKDEFGDEKPSGKEGVKEIFTESEIQRKLFLYFALCTKKHDLLIGLLDVYMTSTPGVRKVIQQQIAGLITTISMNSVPLLQLVAQCPKGGESFILQILRILTESTRPTTGLVNAVKTAHKRLGDARLLIPVLAGMEKDEVVGLLPRLLVLPPVAAKNVVTRLAVGHSPLACTELLVAIHLVENVPIKRMLEATQYCLEMDTVFKQDVMAVVLSQLSSQPHVPQLFMFTSLQTLQRFHKLTGYIIELMINLIPKQVWTDKRLWEGFIRCCKVAKPTSYKVLLKLPAGPLEEYLKAVPDFKEPLAKAAKADKKSIPKAVLKVLGFDEPAAEGEREV